MKQEIKFKKLNEEVILPAYEHGSEESAGMDIRSLQTVVIVPGNLEMISTGVSIEMPPGIEAQLRIRSSVAKRSVIIPNSPATIDPGYRGEIKVMLLNLGRGIYTVQAGDRIAQLVFSPYIQVQPVEQQELAESIRGDGGFGSTGR
jgi:dUTP pyrophosphatase